MQETTLIFARAQMELSLAFHMVFAALGIGMPLLMVLAEVRFVLGHGEHFRELARTWGRATALLFAIGAVSGTALSFELGLLWPKLMWLAGPAIGPAFVVEGYAFFLEAIFVGLYLYGWERFTAKQHLLVGIPVALSGLVSGILVVAANAWMQKPAAFTLGANGEAVPTSSLTAFSSPMWAPMSVHSSLACYASVGFAVAGVYAYALRSRRREGRGRDASGSHRSPEYLRAGFRLALAVGAVAALCQGISGDASARELATEEPIKLAAMEAHYQSGSHVPLEVGGWADSATRTLHGAIAIPGGLSFLAKGDWNSEIDGLETTAKENWPNVPLVHLAFDTMVGCGSLLALVAMLFAVDRLRAWRTRRPGLGSGPIVPGQGSSAVVPGSGSGPVVDEPRWFVSLVLLASPLGFVALEAGWFVTEAGRQPWAVQGLLRVADAVTSSPGVPVVFFGFALLYVLLAVALVGLLRALSRGHDMADAAH
jgi:cytochrome d ubiquinol oxidase subunit I